MAFYYQGRNLFTLIFSLQILFVFSDTKTGAIKLSSLVSKFQDQAKSVSFRGPPGLPGRDGRDGRDVFKRGTPGKSGKPGPRGPPGPKGDSASSTGVVYTRWGRKSCPATSKTVLLYSGVMAGSYYTHHGGGSNHLCLPKNPIYDKYRSGYQRSSYIYGTEYKVNRQSSIFPTKVHDHDAPCAVCHAESRGSHVMIPARNVCPSGWTLEYKGYLMAAHHNHAGRTQYICVDSNPSAISGTYANRDGALLYFVEGRCGSLPCRPYVGGYEMTCAVCTK